MALSYLLIFLSLSAWGQSTPTIQVLPEPQNPENFEHQYKGCLENSECDQVMGLQLQRWQDLISKVKEDKIPDNKKAQYLELFRVKYGIPVEFYTNLKSQQGFKPLYFNSPCKDHNPKQKDQKVLIGMSFVKGLSKDKATVWRDQTQIEVPTEELFIPQPVTVYYPEGAKTYYLPLNDQPLFLKNNELFILKEDDGFFYTLKINAKGEWKIENLDLAKIGQWDLYKQEVTCPKEKSEPAPKIFGVEFCKTIWNDEAKKTVVVKFHQGCVK